jgi:dTDP-4-amino-4,6-dideoxygalactose transaminase
MNEPYIITFPKLGGSALDYISVAEKENLPFEAKRIYWTYQTPENDPTAPHKQPAYSEWEEISFPISELIHDQIIYLPISPVMTSDEISKVADIVNQY